MSLTGKTKAGSYKDLLQMNQNNTGIGTSAKPIVDGEGTASALSISDDQVIVQPQNDDTTDVLMASDKDGNRLFKVDSSNDLVKAGIGQHIVNTQVKCFNLASPNTQPTTTDTWAMMSAQGESRFGAEVTFGTGSTPATTYTISNNAHDVVMGLWYLPFNITIDSCNVWFGADAASGDAVKFSVMQYAVDSANGSTSGDLSSGSELCNQSLAISGAGYEQAYYKALTVASANVDAGKVIMAFVHQNGTNADLTVNMQLVYHLR